MGRVGPKLLTLGAYIAEHEGAIETDLSRFHGLTLDDVGTERLSFRRLGHYLAHSPSDSALMFEESGGPWVTTDALLANVIDLLQGANYQRSGDKNAKRPTPFPRPWERKTRRPLTDEQRRRLEARGPRRR